MNNRSLSLFFFLFFVFFCFHISGQNKFLHITSIDGLSQSEVYSFLEDSKGFMWIGTLNGLNYYDGYQMTQFNTNKDNPYSLRNNTIRCIKETPYGDILIGTDNNISLFDYATKRFYPVNVCSNEIKTTIWDLFIQDSTLFVGTSHGLWQTTIKPSNGQQSHYNFSKITSSINDNDPVRAITAFNNSYLWVLTAEKILKISTLHDGSYGKIIDTIQFENFKSHIGLVVDSSNCLWIISDTDGLLRFNPKTKEINHFNKYGTDLAPASNKCSAINIDNLGNIWIGTIDRGLSFISNTDIKNNNLHFSTYKHNSFNPSSLSSNLIYSIYTRRNNQIWIGTIGAGINIFAPNQKQFYQFYCKEIPNSDFIRSIFIDKNNDLWIGTHSNGIIISSNGKLNKSGFDTQSIFFITKFFDKFIVCSENGVYLISKNNSNLRIIDSFKCGPSFCVTHTGGNHFWIASINGLIPVSIVNEKITPINNSSYQYNLNGNNCRILFFDQGSNKLYVGTEGCGLYVIKLDNEQSIHSIKNFRHINNDKYSISNNYIRTIIQDKNRVIWIGTYEGLNKIIPNGDKLIFESFTTADGLPNNMIQSITEDKNGNLWIGTNFGLSRFNTKLNTFNNYTTDDGISNNEFSEHTSFRKEDGLILLGGINGITYFYPNSIKLSSIKPHTTITRFYLFNKEIDTYNTKGSPLKKNIVLSDTIILEPNQNNFAFEVSSMIYPANKNIQYLYKLDGFDEKWQPLKNNNRIASYTNLKYGKYRFRIKSTNDDGTWEEGDKSIYIIIKTPFYYSKLAFILYFIIFIGLFVYFTNYYISKKRIILERDHTKKMLELDDLRIKFFINISHDLRTPLTLIREPLETIIDHESFLPEIKNKLLLIKRNVSKLNYLIEQLLDIRKAEMDKIRPQLINGELLSFTKKEMDLFDFALMQKNIILKIESTCEYIHMQFDPDMMSKIYFNIITNAIKYTESGQITIAISPVKSNLNIGHKKECLSEYISIEITDTGCGMSQKEINQVLSRFYSGNSSNHKGYGIGLSHTQELIKALGGEISIESQVGKGSTFKILIPFTKPEISNSEKNTDTIPSKTNQLIVDENFYSNTNVANFNNDLKIIVVAEDNWDMSMFIKDILKNQYNVITAVDGKDAIEKTEKYIPDLIISDLMMPNVSGIDFCKMVKTNIETSHIPFILLTAKNDIQTKINIIDIGADDYIPKPFDTNYLLTRINNLIKSREQLRLFFQKKMLLDTPLQMEVTSFDEIFIQKLMDTINENLSDPEFNIQNLENAMSMSHAHFYRKVKSLTGQSGQEILYNLRMKKAYQILSEKKELRVSEVAFLVGFSNPKYFSKCYKETFGISPSDTLKG